MRPSAERAPAVPDGTVRPEIVDAAVDARVVRVATEASAVGVGNVEARATVNEGGSGNQSGEL